MLVLFRDLRRYIWAHVLWLAQLKKAWLCIAVLILVVIAAQALPGKHDDRLRYAGLVLQLLGVGTVAYLLRDKRATFNRKSMLSVLREWSAARPRFRPKAITLEVSSSVQTSTLGSARTKVWRRAQPNSSVEERLDVLEANLTTLQQEHSETTNDLRSASGRIADDLSAEKRSREEAMRLTNEKLEKFGAGGLHIEATGLVWLVAGIVLATIPAELATVFIR
jgi:hypothetical protein